MKNLINKILIISIGIIIIITTYAQQPKKRKIVAVSGIWTWTITDTIKSLAGGTYQTVATWTWQGTSTDTPKIHKNGKALTFIPSTALKNLSVSDFMNPVVVTK